MVDRPRSTRRTVGHGSAPKPAQGTIPRASRAGRLHPLPQVTGRGRVRRPGAYPARRPYRWTCMVSPTGFRWVARGALPLPGNRAGSPSARSGRRGRGASASPGSAACCDPGRRSAPRAGGSSSCPTSRPPPARRRRPPPAPGRAGTDGRPTARAGRRSGRWDQASRLPRGAGQDWRGLRRPAAISSGTSI